MPLADAPASLALPAEPALVLRLELVRGRVVGARLEVEHLPEPQRILLGRPVGEAVEIAGRLMAVCGTAHRQALTVAAEAALGCRASPARQAARALRLLAERARALALRRAVAWPAVLGQPAWPELARAIFAAAAALERATGLTGPRDVLAPDPAAAEAAALRLAAALAPLDRDPLPGWLRAATGRTPGRLARLLGRRLAARLTLDRRLAEEARAHLPALAAEPALPELAGTGEGSGFARTDRGRLVYRVRLARGRLVALVVSSPTDRLLAAGWLPAALVGLREKAELEGAASLALGLVDPCWTWRIERARLDRRPPTRSVEHLRA